MFKNLKDFMIWEKKCWLNKNIINEKDDDEII